MRPDAREAVLAKWSHVGRLRAPWRAFLLAMLLPWPALWLLPAADAAGPEDPKRVAVRVGEHPDFERVVLQAPGASDLPVSIAGERVRIAGAPLPSGPDVSRLRRLDSVRDVVAAAKELVIVLGPGVTPKLLRLKPDRLVLDLYTATERPPAPKAAGPRGADTHKIAKAGSAGGRGPQAGVAAAEPQRPPHAGPARSDRAPGTRPAPTGSLRRAEATRPPPPAPAPAPEPAAEASARGGSPASDTGEDAAVARPVAITAAPPPAVRSILFDWPVPVGAAAYLRSGRAWIVFDAVPETFLPDRNGLAALASQGLRRIGTYRREDASLVELVLDGAPALRLYRDGPRWIAELGKLPGPEAGPTLAGTPVQLRLRPVHRLLTLRDPVVGDTVSVATAREPLAGAVRGLRLVDLEVLPSPQGLAWLPRAGDLQATIAASELVVSRPTGLRVTGDLVTDGGTPEVDSGAPSRPAADPARAGRGEPDDDSRAADVSGGGRNGSPGGDGPARAEAHSGAAGEPDVQAPPETAHEGADGDIGPPMPEPPAGQAGRATGLTGLPPWDTALGIVELAESGPVSRRAMRRRVRLALSEAEGVEAARLALELARLYLAEAFPEETLTSLRLAPEDASNEAAVARKRALVAGAALALKGELQSARRLLTAPEFSGEPEAALWLGLLDAEEKNWDSAARALEAGAELFAAYPEPLRLPFALRALAVALQTGDADRAYVWLDRLLASPAPPGYRNRIRFLEAMTLARDGAYEEARQILLELAARAPWRIAAESAYAAIDLAHEFGRTSPEEKLAALEAQRHMWRGHPWEPRVLGQLGELRSQLGRPYAALASWREALDRYPDDPSVGDLATRMRQLFAAALDPDRAPRPPVLEALRIYREFAELRPAGEEGARMTRWLARSLAGHGLARSALALARADLPPPDEDPPTRRLLADLSLAADEPEQALRLLGTSVDDADGRILRARALLARGRAEEAVDTIAGMRGPQARRVLADAAWAAGRSRLLVDLADELLAQAAESPDPMDHVRAARALAALAQTDPAEAVGRLGTLQAVADPALAATIEMFAARGTLSGAPPAVVTAAREWAARSRERLALLRSRPVRTADRGDGPAGL